MSQRRTAYRTRKRVQHLNWTGCYDRGWGKVLLPESYSHPAKVSFKLAERIYDFMFTQGWLKEGDTCLDPFAGIGGFAYGAMSRGLNFVGIELEPRFHELGAQEYDCPGFSAETWKRIHYRPKIIAGLRAHGEIHALMCPSCETELRVKKKLDKKGRVVEQRIPFREAHRYRGNIPLWNHRYSRLPHWGTAQILQGDSRKLLDVIQGAGSVVSSPPYASSDQNYAAGWSRVDNDKMQKGSKRENTVQRFAEYGVTPGQLAALREGNVQAAISSPPYAQALNPESVDPIKRREREERYRAAHPEIKRPDFGDYGETDGQLANMPESGLSAAISSPPYAAARVGDECGAEHVGKNGNYGKSDGQLGAMPTGMVSSPPYAGSTVGSREYIERMERLIQEPIESLAPRWQREVRKYLRTRRATDNGQFVNQDYGHAAGQLGSMREGELTWPTIQSGSPAKVVADSNIETQRNAYGVTISKSSKTPPLVTPGARKAGTRGRAKKPINGRGETLRTAEGQEENKAKPKYLNGEAVASDVDMSASSTFTTSNQRMKQEASGTIQTEIYLSFAEPATTFGITTDGLEPTTSLKTHQPTPLGSSDHTEDKDSAQFTGCISSPPYIPKSDRRVAWGHDHEALQREDEKRGYTPVSTFRGSYSNNPDNLGNPTGANQETFWGASRLILEQAYAALAPGAHVAWVCKRFVRNKQIVEFSQQWAQLAESVGFQTVAWARAWQTKDPGTQLALDGNHKSLKTKKVGFFRRLHESKFPETAIDWEDVIFQVKP